MVDYKIDLRTEYSLSLSQLPVDVAVWLDAPTISVPYIRYNRNVHKSLEAYFL